MPNTIVPDAQHTRAYGRGAQRMRPLTSRDTAAHELFSQERKCRILVQVVCKELSHLTLDLMQVSYT